MDYQQNSSINQSEALSEDTQAPFETAELMEFMFEETILTQHHKLFAIIEKLDHIQWSNYTYGEGFKKLTSIIKQLDKIRTNSLDLPEFIKRARAPPSGRYYVDYAYIHKILRDWRIAEGLIDDAKTKINNLPVFFNPGRSISRPPILLSRNQKRHDSKIETIYT